MDEELKTVLKEIDDKLQRIEGLLSSDRKKIIVKEIAEASNEEYSGLRGGIRSLVSGGYLNEPKTAD